jgi:HK97 gp10 family phage protein
MTNVGRVKLEGLEELKANLEALGKEVATKVGIRATREAAKAVAEAVRAYAPIGTQSTVRTRRRRDGTIAIADYGRLRDNIRVRRARARKETTITFNVTTGNAFWGKFLEFGTVHMPARPWMRPAFDASAAAALNITFVELKKGIDREVKKMRVGRPVLPNGRSG